MGWWAVEFGILLLLPRHCLLRWRTLEGPQKVLSPNPAELWDGKKEHRGADPGRGQLPAGGASVHKTSVPSQHYKVQTKSQFVFGCGSKILGYGHLFANSLALRRLRQENCKVKASLHCMARSLLSMSPQPHTLLSSWFTKPLQLWSPDVQHLPESPGLAAWAAQARVPELCRHERAHRTQCPGTPGLPGSQLSPGLHRLLPHKDGAGSLEMKKKKNLPSQLA